MKDHPEYAGNDNGVFVAIDRAKAAAHEYECALGQPIHRSFLVFLHIEAAELWGIE